MSNFSAQYETFAADGSKRVTEMTVKLTIKDATGEFGVTDVMLQRGTISTEWAAHPSEIKWTTNE